MAISYSGIVGYGKYNLPSVETWGTNNNILKDPPRSITTRRRDKVGLNSTITQEVEMSRDRVAEVIKAYPRGVNPMVGVSYNGSGNAGIHGGIASGQQAKLPYRVAMAGAFRPPVLAPVDLLPLSRMPRLITKVNCSVNKPDFQKKLSCAAEKGTYKHKIMNTSCAPQTRLNIKKPIEIIDRRHLNTRKNALAQDIISGKCAPMAGKRGYEGEYSLKKEILPAAALDMNQRRNVQFSGARTGDIARHIGRTLIGDMNAAVSGARREETANMATLNYEKYTAVPLRASTTAQVSGARREETANMATLNYEKYTVNPLNKSAAAIKTGIRKDGGAAPQHIASSCRAESFRTSIEPVNVISRRAPQDQPEYKRTFGRGGILVPDAGNYNGRK